jgi:hypothetical protein
MAVSDPPIQQAALTTISRFVEPWALWFVNLARAINMRTSWFDYNDAETAATPVNHTGGATNTYLTNDGAGSFTQTYAKGGLETVYDTSTDAFDFSSLKIGDTITIRVDLTVTTSVNNQEYQVYADCAIGSGADYSLPVGVGYHKMSGVYQHISLYEMYIGNNETKNFPTKLRFESADNATIRVNGWWVKVTIV